MKRKRYAVASVKDIMPDIGYTVPMGNTSFCTLFLHSGKFHAVGDLCPHQNAPLHGSNAVSGEVVCKRHGYRFALKDGDCRTIGGYGLPVYPVELIGETLYVSCWEESEDED